MCGLARFALATFLLMVPSLTPAEDKTPEHCGDLATGAEQKHCAEIQYRRAAEALKEVYGRVLERAAGVDERAAIADSQRTWEAYRDAECRGVIGRGGGSGRMVWVLSCLTEKTDARSGELKIPYDAR